MVEKEKEFTLASNILFIDDEEDFLNSVINYFPENVSVYVSQTLSQAWSVLNHYQIDCIFCDLNLGNNRSGMELLKRCRENNINVPFVFVSGFIDKNKTIEAIRNGAIDIIEKPINEDYLNKQLPKYIASGKKVHQINKDMNSISLVTEKHNKEGLGFVEDYLFHVQIFKNRKAS